MPFAYRNLALLICAQLVFVSASVITVTMGGIIGSELSPTPNLATFPVSLMILGTALGTIPATKIMQAIGRKRGFMGAALTAAFALWLAEIAIQKEDFWLYCIATATTGITIAFSAQFRFAAAESVELSKAGLAISLILVGSIGGAIVGPELIARGDVVHPNAFIGALKMASLLFLGASVLLFFLKIEVMQTAESSEVDEDIRPYREIASNPLFLLAVISGTVGYGVMTYVMTATPVSMHLVHGHSVADTANVIRAHVLGMYVPSLFSGWLITRFGERPIIAAGLIAYLVTLAAALSGHEIMHYTAAMVLLGVGWNFMFVGGTTLLVKTYRASERFKAQGLNEFAVFGTSALGSLFAGSLLSLFGWTTVILSTIPALILVGILLFKYRNLSSEHASE